MRGRDKLLLAALAAALIAFGLGLARLLNLRLEVGDVYPPYSSHRTDPLGASALADALAEVGVDVQRNHKPLSRLPAGRGATLMVLGAAPRWLEGLSGDDATAWSGS